MGIFSLFELFLVLFTFYAIIKFDGVVRILVPIMCLVVVFLFERLQGRMKEDEEAKKRLLKYKLDDHRKESIQMESEEDIT
ncbi:MAG: hypothetical protein JRC57_09780 [Deltaproteobacteria bacterium]|nr:hypothetical protein [Deltaproteobacteria bacterium]MCK5514217.1 hypothetical protein [Deltaproteobacteria bacterium]